MLTSEIIVKWFASFAHTGVEVTVRFGIGFTVMCAISFSIPQSVTTYTE